ncbi:MAG: hypothetical protein JWM29_190 [Solirubrobacterales bacterium]|nr:hypothetical protein [Solirubrobacterales bacterium]
MIRSRPWQPAIELAQLDVADVTPQPDTELLRAPD